MMISDKNCPYCGATDQRTGFKCQSCSRLIPKAIPKWAQERGKRTEMKLFGRSGLIFMTQNKWLAITLIIVLSCAYFLHNYKVIPNPITLILSSPTTQLSADPENQPGAVVGSNLKRTNAITNITSQPIGQTMWSLGSGSLDGVSRPTIVDNILYIGHRDWRILAINATSGDTIWEHKTNGFVNSSPSVAGDLVFVGSTDAFMRALDRKSGHLEWKFKANGPITSSPIIVNGFVFFGTHANLMYALDATTGEELWSYDVGDAGGIYASPSFHEGVLYFTSQDGSIHSVNHRTGQTKMKYRSRSLSASHFPVIENSLVYSLSGNRLLAIDAEMREIPARWQFVRTWYILYAHRWPVPPPPSQQGFKWWYSADENSFFSSPPAVTHDGLYIGDSMGRLLARDPIDPSKNIWTFQATGQITTTPLVLENMVYFGTKDGIIYALDRDSGNEIWNLDLGSPIILPITYGSEKLLVRTEDGNLIAIQ